MSNGYAWVLCKSHWVTDFMHDFTYFFWRNASSGLDAGKTAQTAPSWQLYPPTNNSHASLICLKPVCVIFNDSTSAIFMFFLFYSLVLCKKQGLSLLASFYIFLKWTKAFFVRKKKRFLFFFFKENPQRVSWTRYPLFRGWIDVSVRSRVAFLMLAFTVSPSVWMGGRIAHSLYQLGWILLHEALIREEKVGCFLSFNSPSLSFSLPAFCLSPWDMKWDGRSMAARLGGSVLVS